MVERVKKFINVILVFALVYSVSLSVVYAEEQPAAAPAATAAPAEPAAAAAPAPPAVTGSAAMSILNRYIFRGYELSSHSLVLQPSLTINYSGFSASLW